jgi:cytoskeletal protein RodZ
MLRDARVARGISLDEAERDTKIRARYLAALEDDKPAALPGSVYARGFIRNYAHYLGIDPEEALGLYDRDSQPTRTKIKAARGEPTTPKGRNNSAETISIHPLSPQPVDTRVRYGSSYIAVSMLAVPLILIFYFIYSFWGVSRNVNLPIPTPGPPTLTPISLPTLPAAAGTGAFNTPTVAVALPPALVSSNTTTPPPNPTNKPANQVAVKIVTTRDAWMRVLVDGVQQFNGTLPQGTNRTWTGKNKVRIRTGRADAVQVTVNGADKGLMRVGAANVVEKEWDRSGNEKIIK